MLPNLPGIFLKTRFLLDPVYNPCKAGCPGGIGQCFPTSLDFFSNPDPTLISYTTDEKQRIQEEADSASQPPWNFSQMSIPP